MANNKAYVIGGGLAGAEAALQLLDRGIEVVMYEMRPVKNTGAHSTDAIAELVCSNSLKSTDTETASGLLKAELCALGVRLLGCAEKARVPSGSALAVDRKRFSELVTAELTSRDGFTLVRGEVTAIPADAPVVIATGPLTSPALLEELSRLSGSGRLYFYDAVAPIVTFESVDMSHAYFGGRYGKGGEDYLNLPMNREEYETFYKELVSAETVTLKDFEKKELFDGCMPVEEMAKRGSDTMRFGPLRPVGLSHPVTGEKAYAVVQLRKEDVAGNCYNLVGFQTNLTFPEQRRVFGLIPALRSAEFVRYGVMHRNTYVRSPGLLDATFRVCGDRADALQREERCPVYIAGQLSGVEGYVESIMSGMIAGVALAAEMRGQRISPVPADTVTGALARYVSSHVGDFQPMNANYGLLAPVEIKDKKQRKRAYGERSLAALEKYMLSSGWDVSRPTEE